MLRGMQFTARFGLTPAPETVALCRSIEPEGLAAERIYDEWLKLVLTGEDISAGLRFLADTGWIRYFPELEALQGCEQDPEWHPEGDVWVHTGHVMDAFAAERTGRHLGGHRGRASPRSATTSASRRPPCSPRIAGAHPATRRPGSGRPSGSSSA